MSGFWSRLLSLTRKEFRQLLRDRSNLAIGILLPMVLILIFGYGMSLDVKNAPVAVVMEDASPAAHEAIAGLELSPTIAPVLLGSMHDAEELMRERKVDGIVRVPSDFSRSLAAGNARVQLIVHGSDAGRASIIQAYVTGALMQSSVRRLDRGGNSTGADAPPTGSVTVEQRMWFNAANTSTWYLVPGLIVLIMTLVGAFLTALVMAREWERGTLEALFVTPVRPVEILLAKIIPYFAVGMLGLALCLLSARYLFAVPMYGSLIVVVFASMLYLIVAVSLGLVISSVTRNQFLASQVALIATFMPSMMLSGFLFDLRNVPTAVWVIGHLLPATYFMDLIKTLFLAGDVWPLVWRNCAILLAYAVGLLLVARAVTRKSLD
ncbi:ABC transporter permease [Variovorax sp. NFACC27]|uniref:ABC transporter permease n=1 Tax=unclassified Variovorax TaxID=663243 RepID=UPI000897F8D6|nr:ABC-2 type transport system permease protein [Variovorax sp. NFACC28]SEG77249.1 ABC-2 type transport system permease protein [Variovorax sp. NFACC29]SFC98392.1 ABC-2 type transport system permease protein [Variovorax sp. NFACC26]SFG10878.1 ABC-2 type transport system permease protein [Variovorax sp. NFACC27]